ncbi:non-ribosomal peptide synthetase [Nonomuraea recticatena]|uniref:Carrier domain-containing protein n=1 Tax=Nonomuraea recticatena TaxID=46178 RepID=A0ABN3T7C7_9ACTN
MAIDVIQRLMAVPGERTALVEGERRLTFAELRERVARVSGGLARRGAGPESVVALMLPRGIDLVICLLGTLAAGAAYVPIDPKLPVKRRAYLLRDCGASLVVAGAAAAPDEVAVTPGELVSRAPEREPARVSGDTLAYVIYTSGSTGAPKGVQVSRASLAALLASLEGAGLTSTAPARVGWNAAASFDASVQQWVRLCRGDTVVIVPETVRSDPEALARLAADEELTCLDITPSHLDLVLDRLEPGELTLLVGGEAISQSLWDRIAGATAAGGPRAANVYGPTECTVDATFAWITQDTGPHLGEPLPGGRLRLLDDELNPVPAGMVGEICLSGPGVARGYLGRPGLTALSFLPDAEAADGSRMYRTGDLARRTPDGRLEFAGRRDHQVKLSGYRIELGEIEAVLAQAPGVAECVVLLRDDLDTGRGLVAYCRTGEEPAGPGQWRAHLEAHLPAYMVPAAFVALDAFPLTSHGKLDRGALPRPTRHGAAGTPQRGTPTEELIAAAWRQVLRAPHISGTDNFFRLGGHSLLAIKVVSCLKKELGLTVTMDTVFRYPVLRDLAAHVDSLRGADLPA